MTLTLWCLVHHDSIGVSRSLLLLLAVELEATELALARMSLSLLPKTSFTAEILLISQTRSPSRSPPKAKTKGKSGQQAAQKRTPIFISLEWTKLGLSPRISQIFTYLSADDVTRHPLIWLLSCSPDTSSSWAFRVNRGLSERASRQYTKPSSVLAKKWQGEKWFQMTLSTWPLKRHTRWLSWGFLQSYSTADLGKKGTGNKIQKSRQNTSWHSLFSHWHLQKLCVNCN